VRFAHDVRVQEYIVFFLERLIKMIGCHLWAVGYVGCGPQTLRFYDFSLQILFQEMEIGHL
jgi:hypothetical protein